MEVARWVYETIGDSVCVPRLSLPCPGGCGYEKEVLIPMVPVFPAGRKGDCLSCPFFAIPSFFFFRGMWNVAMEMEMALPVVSSELSKTPK